MAGGLSGTHVNGYRATGNQVNRHRPIRRRHDARDRSAPGCGRGSTAQSDGTSSEGSVRVLGESASAAGWLNTTRAERHYLPAPGRASPGAGGVLNAAARAATPPPRSIRRSDVGRSPASRLCCSSCRTRRESMGGRPLSGTRAAFRPDIQGLRRRRHPRRRLSPVARHPVRRLRRRGRVLRDLGLPDHGPPAPPHRGRDPRRARAGRPGLGPCSRRLPEPCTGDPRAEGPQDPAGRRNRHGDPSRGVRPVGRRAPRRPRPPRTHTRRPAAGTGRRTRADPRGWCVRSHASVPRVRARARSRCTAPATSSADAASPPIATSRAFGAPGGSWRSLARISSASAPRSGTRRGRVTSRLQARPPRTVTLKSGAASSGSGGLEADLDPPVGEQQARDEELGTDVEDRVVVAGGADLLADLVAMRLGERPEPSPTRPAIPRAPSVERRVPGARELAGQPLRPKGWRGAAPACATGSPIRDPATRRSGSTTGRL